jgi:hypothetical protein
MNDFERKPLISNIKEIGKIWSLTTKDLKQGIKEYFKLSNIDIGPVITRIEGSSSRSRIRIFIGLPADSPHVSGGANNNIAPHLRGKIQSASLQFSSEMYKCLTVLAGSEPRYEKSNNSVVIELDTFRAIGLILGAKKGELYILDIFMGGKNTDSVIYSAVVVKPENIGNEHDYDKKYYDIARNM